MYVKHEKKKELINTENRLAVLGAVKWVKGVKRLQTSSFQIVNSGDVIYIMVTIVTNSVLCILKLLRVNFKCSHH